MAAHIINDFITFTFDLFVNVIVNEILAYYYAK